MAISSWQDSRSPPVWVGQPDAESLSESKTWLFERVGFWECGAGAERRWGQLCLPSQLQAISNICLDAGQRTVLSRCKGGPGMRSSHLRRRAWLLIVFRHPRQRTSRAPFPAPGIRTRPTDSTPSLARLTFSPRRSWLPPAEAHLAGN